MPPIDEPYTLDGSLPPPRKPHREALPPSPPADPGDYSVVEWDALLDGPELFEVKDQPPSPFEILAWAAVVRHQAEQEETPHPADPIARLAKLTTDSSREACREVCRRLIARDRPRRVAFARQERAGRILEMGERVIRRAG